jgi:hypothetical protein
MKVMRPRILRTVPKEAREIGTMSTQRWFYLGEEKRNSEVLLVVRKKFNDDLVRWF